jgi:hypothetical protein
LKNSTRRLPSTSVEAFAENGMLFRIGVLASGPQSQGIGKRFAWQSVLFRSPWRKRENGKETQKGQEASKDDAAEAFLLVAAF